MRCKQSIVTLILMLALVQCRTEQKEDSLLTTNKIYTPVKPTLTGLWKYKNSIWEEAYLQLNSDSSFTFTQPTCFGKRFTRGHWQSSKGCIVLSSDTRFKQWKQTLFPNAEDTVPLLFEKLELQLQKDSLFATVDAIALKDAKFVKL